MSLFILYTILLPVGCTLAGSLKMTAAILLCCRYTIGKVLGAGSFGIVREATHNSTGRVYACKTVPKIPKRGNGTPRYLLKLQTEVDAMQQLGSSFDAVHLRVWFPSRLHVLDVATCASWPRSDVQAMLLG